MERGAPAGAAGGAASDSGVDDDFMKRLGSELEPGKAALIVLVRKMWADKVLPQIQVSGTVSRRRSATRMRAHCSRPLITPAADAGRSGIIVR